MIEINKKLLFTLYNLPDNHKKRVTDDDSPLNNGGLLTSYHCEKTKLIPAI